MRKSKRPQKQSQNQKKKKGQVFHKELHPKKQVFHQVVVNYWLHFISQENERVLASALNKQA